MFLCFYVVMIPSTIFRPYDIRGLAPGEIDETVARRLGKACAKLYSPKHVVIGRDVRATSDVIEAALVEAFILSGVSVTRVGLCSTPMFYAAIGEAQGAYELGVMVTASHNPPEYNGFKIMRFQNGAVIPISQGLGMEELRDLAISDEALFDAATQGSETQDDGLLERYVDRICSLAKLPERFPPWRIALDAGNGMAGIVLPKLSKRLMGIEVTRLFWDLDSRCPNHEANPIKIETLAALRASVAKNQCVLGAAYDGDADRIGLVDEEGVPIRGDILTAILASEILRMKGSGVILYDSRASWSVPDAVRAAGGDPRLCKVGHGFFKHQMGEDHGIFGGELSGHYYFPELWNCESGDLVLLLVLQMLLRERKPLSAIRKTFQQYIHSGEINFTVSNREAALSKLEQQFAPQAALISHLDGIRLEFRDPIQPENDWWFNARPAANEPLLRLTLEARSVEQMEYRKEELTRLIVE
ncbi:MAG: phosphomannomutase/phosphoglucomutase [Candidatus Uhrbacteria bacterium]|nr:phosphomannomutase/phosphoglucomutase [Candidatus Uhrbacteria bacterium]